jgi:hypothetical protein
MSHRGRDRTLRRGRPRRWRPAVSAGFVGSAGVAVLVLGLCFLYLIQGMALRDLTARSADARAALVDAQEINRTLEFRIEQAFSLERISRIARERLGMVEPTVVHYVPLPESNE